MSKKIKVLVTGGTGYIGSHTVVELIEQGFEVVIVDNLSNSEPFILERIKQITGVEPTFYQYDLTDPVKVSEIFKEHSDIQGVIHFAANKAVGESVEKPLMYYRNNLNSLINILDGLKLVRSANLVFSSSCTVYGQPEQLPVTEEAPVQPAMSPYGNTKQICEEIIQDTLNAGVKMNAVALRYFNPIGAHPSGLIGELPIGVPNNLVPFITQTAIGIREQLKVFGDDYNTPDGSCIRDYIHVVDLAKAHIVALKRMLESNNASAYEMFNLGTGNGFSVLEVIHSFEKVTSKPLNYKIVDRRPGDIEQIWADTNRANGVLGWKAELDLDTMMRDAWNWEQKYRESKKP